MAMQAINPANGEPLGSYEEHSPQELQEATVAAHGEFEKWRRLDFPSRALPMNAAAKLLRARSDSLARLITSEMGKPIVQARSEVEKCAKACEYFAENAASFLASQNISTEAAKSFVTFEPLGVLLAVMPWNFPFWQVFRAAAPALMAGNAVLLKHASNVPGCALAIGEVFQEAGFPVGLFRALLTSKDGVETLVADPFVSAITLTGSVSAGRKIAELAGRHLKKAVLELGGSDPYLILEDADMETAVETCVNARLINNGQSCIAAKRFIVARPILEKFEALFVSRMKAQKMGNPMDEEVTVGPMAREDLRRELHEQVEKTVAQGARLLLGGKLPAETGYFYPPTVLAGVKKGMTAFDEETFGPVAAIVEAQDDDDAIRLANDSRFGLGAAVFTRDRARGERIASKALEAGACFVNAQVASDPRLPFGGIKDSGYGRELSSFGIREFVNIKCVYVK